MNTIDTGYKERVKYIISCEGLGSMEIVDPIGWNDDQKEYARNEKYHGIIAKFSNNLTFIENGADFITTAFALYDIKAKVRLEKYIMHPKTDLWEREYWGFLDMSTKESEGKEIKIKFNSGGLEQDLKVREDDSFEVERETTASGTALEPLVPSVVDIDGRRIFLKSKWDADEINNSITLSVFSDDGNTRNITKPFPLMNIVSSHEQAQSNLVNAEGTENISTGGMMIFNVADRTRVLKFKGEGIKFKPVVTRWDYDWAFAKLCLTVYENGVDYNLKNRIDLFDSDDNSRIDGIHNALQTLNFEQEITVEQGDSVALEFYIKADLKNFVGAGARFTVNFQEIAGKVFLEEDSVYPATTSKFILVHELLDRYLKICTNKSNIFKSNFYGRTDLGYPSNGYGAYLGVTHGFWIRGFEKDEEEIENSENKYKPLTTSFKDIIESLIAVHNVGIGIETIGNKETVRVEDLKYFYQPKVTIKLPNQVQKVKRTILSKKYFSSIEIGYSKGGDYQEAFGLDEPNGKTTLTTIMDTVKEFYTALSKIRSDGYGIEFTRRKPYIEFSTEDTPSDEDLFFLDTKPGFTNFVLRKYADDFEQIPTGIFSPETAFNLRLSPINNLLRHGWFIGCCLTKYPYEYIRYGSSTANSKLRTKLVGKPEYAENDNILNSDLQRPRFLTEEIEFEHNVDFEIMQLVEGFTTDENGDKIPNLYGLIEFVNEDNQIERGYFMNLKPNKEGNWKLIKANI
jgi:hypothetical protein